MKSTLADVGYMFNVEDTQSIVAGPVTNLTEGQFAMIDVDAGTFISPLPNNLSAAPERFKFVSKLNGKTYTTPTIESKRIKNVTQQGYQAGQGEKWETKIECCNCIDIVKLNININSPELMQQNGMTWTDRDFFVEVSPKELNCHCSCDGSKPVLENNVLTMLLDQKIKAGKSSFYTSNVILKDESGLLPSVDPMVKGEVFVNGSDLEVSDGLGGSEVVGSLDSSTNYRISDVGRYVELTKENNSSDTESDWQPMLYLELETLSMSDLHYANVEGNYVYPRETGIQPSLDLGKSCNSVFTKTQDLQYSQGEGYDLRAEEWDNMQYYSGLLNPTLGNSPYQDPNLIYQFENKTNYNVITFEFDTEKVERNSGDTRLFKVLLGFKTPDFDNDYQAVWNALN